jgi:hypothetical protein
MDNPYQSPEASPEPPPGYSPFASSPRQLPGGMVQHVRVVAILMIVQGVLELLMGVGLGAVAALMPTLIRMEMRPVPGPPGQPPPEFAFWMVTGIYGGMAALALVAAALHIVAGVRNYRFRSRTLGIVAMAGGALTVMTCYCLPTAVGVAVYGLIVYLNDSVAEAFRMGEEGRPANEILASFSGFRGYSST